jgi:hypothetical protein
LREGKIDEFVALAERNKKSPLGSVVAAGLIEFRRYEDSGGLPDETIEASKRAVERSEAAVRNDLKRNLSRSSSLSPDNPVESRDCVFSSRELRL